MNAKKTKTVFVCSSCGQEYGKWVGRCQSCNTWGTITEFRESRNSIGSLHRGAGSDTPVLLSLCKPDLVKRIGTGFPDIDRVLGGGLVPGALVLLGGSPGIGKSTVVLQMAASILRFVQSVLYISGEESIEQLSIRSHRLGLSQIPLQIFAETNVEKIISVVNEKKPDLIIVDSVQTLFSDTISSAPGTVAQVRESTAHLMYQAKSHNQTIILIGHVTKDGSIAGPRILEHMVDTVLYFEGDSTFQYRILRSVKNRFGPSGEIAVMSMSDKGLSEVTNISDFFCNRQAVPQIGTAIVPVLEGSRVLLVELQALVNRSHFGLPQRIASGINPKKLSLVIAVIERYTGVMLGDHDIFFNITGGIAITEPAVDAAIAGAIISSYRNKPIKKGMALVGEVGLGGEIRPVNNISLRLRELARLGFTECVVPVFGKKPDSGIMDSGLKLVQCRSIAHLGEIIF